MRVSALPLRFFGGGESTEKVESSECLM